MYTDGSIKKYLEDLAGKKPAPGGGSAAALAGALGIASLEMVCSFTIGNEKYKEVEEDIKNVSDQLLTSRKRFLELVDDDVEAYGGYSQACKIPKERLEERKDAIQKALKSSCNVPLDVCKESFDALKLSKALLDKGNKNLITDVGVGVRLLVAAYHCAKLNVDINLAFIKDLDYVVGIKETLNAIEKGLEDISNEVLSGVDKALSA